MMHGGGAVRGSFAQLQQKIVDNIAKRIALPAGCVPRDLR
jgi:hypothetical protein